MTMVIDTSIIDSARAGIMKKLQVEYRYSGISDYSILAKEVSKDMICSIWNKALLSIDAFNFKESACNAEAAVAACIHAGLDKNNIQYSTNHFRLKMPNLEYSVIRELSGFTAHPVPALFAFMRQLSAIGLSQQEFAEFLFAFDSIVPEIKKANSELLVEIRDVLLEREKERKIKLILDTAEKAAKI